MMLPRDSDRRRIEPPGEPPCQPPWRSRLRFVTLHQQTIEELLATKKYIVENLGKGFINSGQAPFAAPILFARKGDRLL